jgi:hypothetical protein
MVLLTTRHAGQAKARALEFVMAGLKREARLRADVPAIHVFLVERL